MMTVTNWSIEVKDNVIYYFIALTIYYNDIYGKIIIYLFFIATYKFVSIKMINLNVLCLNINNYSFAIVRFRLIAKSFLELYLYILIYHTTINLVFQSIFFSFLFVKRVYNLILKFDFSISTVISRPNILPQIDYSHRLKTINLK